MRKTTIVLAVSALLPAVAMADISINFNSAAASDSSGLTTPVLGATVDTFTDPGRPGWTYSGDGNVFIGGVSSVSANPAGDTTDYFVLPEAYVGTVPATVAVFNFGAAQQYLGLYWGSIDSYNSITFRSGGADLQTFTGSDITSPQAADGNWVNSDTNKYVNFIFYNGQTFDEVVFSTSQVAFEFDNLAVAVPVPGAVLLGMLGLVAAGRKLRKMV